MKEFNQLTELDVSWNNSLAGYLKVFIEMKNLRLLNISHTGLDTGLECLPLSLEEFYCSETKLQEELEKHIRRGELVEKHSNYLFLLNR